MSASTPVRNILITGTSRGLGLEFVRQYVAEPNTHVIATARNLSNATALQELKQKHSNLTLLEVDVTSADSIRSAFSSLPPISLLINNAGIMTDFSGFKDTTVEQLTQSFQTNVIGVLLSTQAALPALQQAKALHGITPVVINISTILSSMKLLNQGSAYNESRVASYRITKTALNMLTATAAQDVTDVTFVALHPGWVDTDMGSAGGRVKPPMTPSQSITSMRQVIANIKHEQSGSLLNYDGTPLEY